MRWWVAGRQASGIGLDIGSNNMRIIQLKRGRTGNRLQAYGEAAVPVDTVEDGIIINSEPVAASIEQVLREAGIRNRRVVASISGQHVYVKSLTLPLLPTRELKQAIRYQAAAYLPIPLEDVVMDTVVYGQGNTDKEVEVLLVAVRRAIIESLVDTLHLARVVVEAVEIEPLSVYRALRSGTDPQNLLIVNIGTSNTLFSLFENRRLRLVRSLPIGGRRLTGSFKELSREVIRTIEYCAIQYHPPGLKKILVTGWGASIEALVEFLQNGLPFPLETGDPLSGLFLPHEVGEEERQLLQYEYSAAIGAARREVI